ncbi:MAG: hypothetical protein H8E46_07830 [FCB group bacterium]|nr:hypothetical protein [FCB group bacterium]
MKSIICALLIVSCFTTAAFSDDPKPLPLAFGVRVGFPVLFGLNTEYALMQDDDYMPSLLLKSEAYLTLGYGGSICLEDRLGKSHWYWGLGYNHLLFSQGGWGAILVDNIVLPITYKSKYDDFTSFQAGIDIHYFHQARFKEAFIPVIKLGLTIPARKP